jgi:CheY-like chemotaxis protein
MIKPDKFVIIDDDVTATMLYSLILKHSLDRNLVVHCFNDPAEGVNFIENEINQTEANSQTVLFLDIDMPLITGWDVLDLMVKMEGHIKNQLTIYMLSSSIAPADKTRAINHPLVTDFIEKPLTAEKIRELDKL